MKKDVEKQLPSKTEYIIKCPLSRRQRYLYDEFINKDETKSKIKNQDFLNLMNVLMQLRKVCNHPDLFEPRSVESALVSPQIKYNIPRLCLLHFFFKNHNHTPLIGLNLLRMELDGHSQTKYLRRIKNKLNIRNLVENLAANEGSISRYEGHFSYKWKRLKVELLKSNVMRNYFQNERKINYEKPIYGTDLFDIMYISSNKEELLMKYGFIKTIKAKVEEEKFFLENFTIAHEPCYAKPIKLIPSILSHQFELAIHDISDQNLTMKPFIDEFHFQYNRQKLIFPDKKLFIFDCGKLNKMIQLLKELKDQKHKVLIFTQVILS